jgi:hypothetical protein
MDAYDGRDVLALNISCTTAFFRGGPVHTDLLFISTDIRMPCRARCCFVFSDTSSTTCNMLPAALQFKAS